VAGGMKKFLWTLFILIILCGTAFFFGWAQIAVPPGSYGVIRSKTHGIDQKIIKEGEFRWIWYKLIPTNAKINVFSINRTEHSFTYQNTLPSAGALAAFAGIQTDFSYEVKGAVSFSLRPDALTGIISAKNITSQADLSAYESSLAGEIEAFILRRLDFYGENTENFEKFTDGGGELSADILQHFPSIENVSCRLDAVKIPDFALYRSIRSLYEDFLAHQKEYLSADLNKKAEIRIDSKIHFDELERYGELLTKYPILLQYLTLEKK
jgi:hypothetical protein